MRIIIERMIIADGQTIEMDEDCTILSGNEETIRKKKFMVLWVQRRLRD